MMTALHEEVVVTSLPQPFGVEMNVATAVTADTCASVAETLTPLRSQSQHSGNGNYLQGMQEMMRSQEDDLSNHGLNGLSATALPESTGEFFPTDSREFGSVNDRMVKSEFHSNANAGSNLYREIGQENMASIASGDDKLKKCMKGKGDSPPTVYPWMKRIHSSHGK